VLERDSLAFESKTKRLALDRQKLLVEDINAPVDELKVRSPVDGQVGQLLVQQRANVARMRDPERSSNLSALENRSADSGSVRARSHDRHAGRSARHNGTYAGEVSAVSARVVNSQVTGRVRFGDRKPAACARTSS